MPAAQCQRHHFAGRRGHQQHHCRRARRHPCRAGLFAPRPAVGRSGTQGDLADIFAQELHELLDNYRCRELADFMFEMEFPKLRSNIPLGSLPTIRANFITERIVDATVQASRSNRYPHLDSIINITPEFDPLRGSISTSGDTQFLNNGIPISIYNVGDEGSLALYDPRAAKHFAPYRFDGVRYTLLFEHTKTRYNIQALRDLSSKLRCFKNTF